MFPIRPNSVACHTANILTSVQFVRPVVESDPSCSSDSLGKYLDFGSELTSVVQPLVPLLLFKVGFYFQLPSSAKFKLSPDYCQGSSFHVGQPRPLRESFAEKWRSHAEFIIHIFKAFNRVANVLDELDN